MTALVVLALAAGMLECPPGTTHAGAPPPFGNGEWCERPGPDGNPRRHGPARDYYEPDLVHVESTWKDGQLDGPWVEYHRDGRKAAEGQYRDGEKDGAWTYYYEGGKVEEEVSFDLGRRHGRFVQWWRNGKKRTEGTFCLGLQCRTWTTWNEEGALLGTVVYEEIRGTP
ncbi:MAG TPA: toxin-antitoxin system YwqK family antitoxin [Anaeromyxobacteraceae bacterium]|nr:toxin-antitoxin system YwqK family antitoxin [Anaeromyxobacteraceae bacterium]